MTSRAAATSVPDSLPAQKLRTSDYTVIVLGLAGISLVGWAYMAYMAWAMDNMHRVDMWMPPSGAVAWSAWDFAMLFVMWLTMMVAMMTPSILPMVSMFATLNSNLKRRQRRHTSTFVFIGGYLIAWAAFSLLASLIQWPMHTLELLNPMMNSRSYLLSGSLLILAGVYQWTPLKDACLHTCRSPMSFLMTGWREGTLGALNLGIRHGIYCIGCCWALMLILFAVGVMNMLWVILIAAFVLAEKVLPGARAIRLLSGLGLILWGGYWIGRYAAVF